MCQIWCIFKKKWFIFFLRNESVKNSSRSMQKRMNLLVLPETTISDESDFCFQQKSVGITGSIFLCIWCYILMEPFSTFITNTPTFSGKMDIWEWRKYTVLSETYYIRDCDGIWSGSLRYLLADPLLLSQNLLNTYLNSSLSSLIVASKSSVSKSWRIWGPTNMPSLFVLWKNTLKNWKHGLVCFSDLVNCFIRPSFICSGGNFFLLLN